jgi:hypothetical protein
VVHVDAIFPVYLIFLNETSPSATKKSFRFVRACWQAGDQVGAHRASQILSFSFVLLPLCYFSFRSFPFPSPCFLFVPSPFFLFSFLPFAFFCFLILSFCFLPLCLRLCLRLSLAFRGFLTRPSVSPLATVAQTHTDTRTHTHTHTSEISANLRKPWFM